MLVREGLTKTQRKVCLFGTKGGGGGWYYNHQLIKVNYFYNIEAVSLPLLSCKVVLNWNCICCTLRSWVHPIFMIFRTFSPRLEDNNTFQFSSARFPHWSNISGCVQNCQNYIAMYHCSPIVGRRSWKSVPNRSHSYLPFQDLLPPIWEQRFIEK